jgi:eukaryotic-like serine/threonine-protein kinase
MSAAAPAEPPVVPGYLLEELLGRGGSGEVWRAVPRRGGPPVAVKVLVAGDPERQAREAALLGELDHPHLVRLHEVVHQPSRGGPPRVALVLDLLPGGSLAALLARRGRLRPGEVVTAIAPVAAALAHAHEHGVVHGDLSPGNIVFTAEGRPVLTDLGVARVLGEAAAAEVTPAYVDPTVARGGAAGPASDVFGVAAAAFHALTGIPPWNAATPADTLAVAASGTLPDLAALAPDAPPDLLAVVLRGLAADPHDRGSAAAFALDLRHACRPEPVRLPRAGVLDAELGRTGRGPRTELTHQVPAGRHRQVVIRQLPAGRARWRGLPGVLGAVAPRAAVVVLVLAVLAGGLWLGTRWGSGAEVPTGPAAATSRVDRARPTAPPAAAEPPPPDPTAPESAPAGPAAWRPVLEELYARRATAFTTGRSAALDGVYTAGSPLRAADERSIAGLTAAGQALRGFAPVVVEVTAVQPAGEEVRIDVVDHRPDYAVVAAGAPEGPPLRSAPGRPPAPVRMVLERTPAGWRIDTAERCG